MKKFLIGIFSSIIIITTFTVVFGQDYNTTEEGTNHHFVTLNETLSITEKRLTNQEEVTLGTIQHTLEEFDKTTLILSIISILISIGVAIVLFYLQRKQSIKIDSIINKRLKSFYFEVNGEFADIWQLTMPSKKINDSKSWEELKKENYVINNCIERLSTLLKENKDIEDLEVTRMLESVKSIWNIEKERIDIRRYTNQKIFEMLHNSSNEAIKYIQKNYF